MTLKAKTQKTPILVVDDHAIVRESLRSVLSAYEVHEAQDGQQALTLAEEAQYAVAVVDIALPCLNGFDVAERLYRRFGLPSVLLSMHEEEGYLEEALRRDIRGYVVKSAPVKELEMALEQVAAGGYYFSAALMPAVVKLAQRGLQPDPLARRLTPREREVLQLIAEGKTNAEIAKLLYRSTSTIRAHREHLMKKLDAHNLADLIRWAIRLRLIVP